MAVGRGAVGAAVLAGGSDQPCFFAQTSARAPGGGDLLQGMWGPRGSPGTVALTRRPLRADPRPPPATPGPSPPSCCCHPLRKTEKATSGRDWPAWSWTPSAPPERGRLRKVQTVPRILAEGPEAGTPCLPPAGLTNPLPPSEFFPSDPSKAFPEGKSGPPSSKGQPTSRLRPEQEPGLQGEGVRGAGPSGGGAAGVSGQGPVEECRPPCPEDPQEAGGDSGMLGVDQQMPDGAGEPGNAASDQVGEGGLCMARGQGGSPGPGAAPGQQ